MPEIQTKDKLITLEELGIALNGKAGVTGVKGNTEQNYRQGNVNLTPANIGAVAKTGDTMTGPLILDNTDRSNRAIHFYANETETGWISTDDQTNAMQLLQHNPNAEGAFSLFQLPAPTPNDTFYGFYSILTNKSPVTVQQGGTGANNKSDAISNLFAADIDVITQYPNKPGIYRITSDIFAHMNPASPYGVLVIFKAGYGIHLYLDAYTTLYVGYSGDTFQEPSTWKVVTSTTQS